MSSNPYETPALVAQYLLFHYGTDAQQTAGLDLPAGLLHFPERCVAECLDLSRLSHRDRALDLGCSVGRSSFELARFFAEVLAVDLSQAFIQTAKTLQKQGGLTCQIPVEGNCTETISFQLSSPLLSSQVQFVTGDALQPKPDWGTFDCVLAANLLDRVPNPRQLLEEVTQLTRPGGQLILISPYTWLEEFTPKQNWPDGATFSFLEHHLRPHFMLHRKKNLPFLIREHARKFQWSYAEATVWIKK